MATLLAEALEPWWIIGSAAVALHGADPGAIGDVDILLAPADARRVLPALGLTDSPGESNPRFRSAILARWTEPPLDVEFMAGFDAWIDGRWVAIRPQTRVAIGGLFVPDRAELAAILRSFGRAQDLDRAASLDQSAGRSIDQKRGPPPATVHSSVTAKPSVW